MIIGVMSDSHGDFDAIEKAVDCIGEVDLWLHAGDYSTDGSFLEKYSGVKTIAVIGNCDGLAAKSQVDEFIEILDKKIWLTHGHHLRVKSNTQSLIEAAKEFGVDIVIYGHTHISDVSWHDDLLVMNPGSVARPHYAKPSLARLVIEKDTLTANLIEIS